MPRVRWFLSLFLLCAPAFCGAAFAQGQASTKPGVGAIPYSVSGEGFGVTFRTWAPFAQSVRVAGGFNGWNVGVHPLHAEDSEGVEGTGWWSVDVPSIFPGAQYKFVIERPNGQLLWRNDPRARRLTNSAGNSIVYNPGAYQWATESFTPPPWNEIVLYEMHLGTFGVPIGGAPPASFDQCIARLDDLAELGINAIQLMPVCEFPGDLSWGYNPSYSFAVESAYGGPDKLKLFVDEAHARGIAVLHDLVHSHWGPMDLDQWQFDGWSLNGLGGIWFYNDFRAHTPWGSTRPDFGRGEVRRYIRDQALLWLEEFRMDGHRWDATKFIRKVDLAGPDIPEGWTLMQWINDEVDATQPWKIQVAEDLDGNPWITKSVGEGGAGFDSQWDAGFVHPIRAALITPDDWARNMWSVRDAILNVENNDAFRRVIYTESHDECANGKSRVPEEIWPGNAASWYSKKRSTLGALVTLASPGIPMLFMGQEFLEDGWFSDDDPLDWTKRTTFAGIRELYRDLIALRRNSEGLSRGLLGRHTNVFHVNDDWKLIAWHRWEEGGAGDDVVAVANFANNGRSNYRIGVPRGGLWRCRFNSDWSGYDPTFAAWPAWDLTAEEIPWNGLSHSIAISIGPYTGLIYSQDPLPACAAADLNCDGMVDGADLGLLLAAWGMRGGNLPGDLNGDGAVDGADLGLLLAAWGPAARR